MKVITISGKAQNGKDTTAGLLKSALEADGYKVLITHYADLLKYICKQFLHLTYQQIHLSVFFYSSPVYTFPVMNN